MGNVFICRRGDARALAYISVSYPSGAACTCTNGSITLTATNTSGRYLFRVPQAGEWTLKAVTGSKETTKKITVEKDQCYSVQLQYELAIFADGALASGYTLGGAFELDAANKRIKVSTDTQYPEYLYSSSPCFINEAINTADYNTLVINCETRATQWGRIGLSTDKAWHDDTGDTSYPAVWQFGDTNGEWTMPNGSGEVRIDISSLHNRQLYFKFCAYSAMIRINEIRLE